MICNMVHVMLLTFELTIKNLKESIDSDVSGSEKSVNLLPCNCFCRMIVLTMFIHSAV